MTSNYAIGIDLGTTNCLLAVLRDGRVEIIENDSGQRMTSACVTFTENERLIGEVAKNLVVDEPENTVYDVKRLIGMRWDDQRVQDEIRRLTFNVWNDDDGIPNVVVKFQNEIKKFRPEEISAMVLEKLKQTATTFLEEEVTRAVISVPSYFNDSQRQATIDAGRIAGLEVLGIISEPTAAAFCYGAKKKKGRSDFKNVLIFDIGGGKFDVSVVNIEMDGKFVVKSTAGDCHLGGSDFDNALVECCLKNFKLQHRMDPSSDKRAMQRLRAECERAKITLSTSNQTSINVDYLFSQQHFSMSITRAQFEVLCRRYFIRIMSLVDDVILEASLHKCDIDDIVLVGGCTRIPKIRKLLQDYFQLKEIKHSSVNPDLAVVNGAAIYAAILNNGQQSLEQCPNLKLVSDVCSHSFGIGVSCGRIVTAIKRNTSFPVHNQISLVTSHDDQTNVMFKIYEGEHILAKNNNLIGQFKIVDIPAAPKGEETIKLSFEIDQNGILNVSACLFSSLISQKLVHKQCCLTDEQIHEKQKIAKWYQRADQLYRDKIVQKNRLETVVYEIKSKLELISSIITQDERQSIEARLTELENCFIKEENGQLEPEGSLKLITEEEIVNQRVELVQFYQSIIDKHFSLKSQ